MSESFISPHASPSTWSAQIAERYQCRLSPVLADWFDSGLWELTGKGEYREPVAPESLLEPAPEVIWPGLMGCDLLPLIGNAAGDWLCVRIDQNNLMSEVVQWYHGGGDWIPWGTDLAQAILFDAAIDRIPGSRRRHAIPAENPRPAADVSQQHSDRWLKWALSHVPASVARVMDEDLPGDGVVAELLDAHVAEVAVRCELIVTLLTHWPRDILNSLFFSDPSLDRSQLARWSFELEQIPAKIQTKLYSQTGVMGSQDWGKAAEHARQVCRITPELAWPWEIAGYAAERSGELQDALGAYRRAATCSVFTDQSIRLDTHWMSHESAKFSVARLKRLSPDEFAESRYYQLLCHPDVRQRRQQATTYWSEQASQFDSAGDPREAHRCYVAAAWDLGAEPISCYASLLDSIAASAQRAGQEGRAEVAHTHRHCLRERYGV